MQSDIVIVGGGPAGLAAAINAAHPGIRVVLLEKEKEIGYPIHTSGATWIDEIKKFDIDERYFNPVRKVRFISPNEEAYFEMDRPRNCILNVRLLYQHLAERAIERGAIIYLNSHVSDPIKINGKIAGVKAEINGKKIDIFSKIIIDASGISGVIARKAGLSRGAKRFGLGAEYSLYAPNWPQDEVLLIVGNKVTPMGYGWVFPEGGKRIKIGVGLLKPISKGDPKSCLDRMIAETAQVSERLEPHGEIEYHCGLIPSEGLLPSTVSNGLIVVGDAAGQILATAGEGIRFALDIGSTAGSVAKEGIIKKKYSKDFLMKYEREWRRKYEKTFKIGYAINYRISRYSDKDWDDKILHLNKMKADLSMKFMKGDFSFGLFFGLLFRNPNILKSYFRRK